MGSCPICLKSLIKESNSDKPLITNPTKDHGLKGMFGFGKTKKILHPASLSDEETVVSTKCGHLFHKSCLRDYLVTFRSIAKQTFVECPICQSRIVMSSTLVVDIRANNRCTDKTNKELKLANIMARELSGQVEVVQKKLSEISMEILKENQLLDSLREEQLRNYEEWATKKTILKEFTELMEDIDKSEKNRALLTKENLELASIYICMLTQGTPCAFPQEVPYVLKQFLKIIRVNEDLLKTFIEVIAPLKSTKDCQVPQQELIVQIIQKIQMLTPKSKFDIQLEEGAKEKCEPIPVIHNKKSSDHSVEIFKAKEEKSLGSSDDSDSISAFDKSSNCSVIINSSIHQPRTISRRRKDWSDNLKMKKSAAGINRNTATRPESTEGGESFAKKVKKRKFRSKITAKRESYTKHKRKNKDPRVKTDLVRKKLSAVTVLVYSKKDYSTLRRPKSPETVEKACNQNQKLELRSPEEEQRIEPSKKDAPVQRSDSAESARYSTSQDSLMDASGARKKYVSIGSQVSGHSFLGSLRDMVPTPLPLYPSDRASLDVPTFNSTPMTPNIQVLRIRPDCNPPARVPKEPLESINRPYTALCGVQWSTLVPYSNTDSSSSPSNSVVPSNTSLGFEFDQSLDHECASEHPFTQQLSRDIIETDEDQCNEHVEPNAIEPFLNNLFEQENPTGSKNTMSSMCYNPIKMAGDGQSQTTPKVSPSSQFIFNFEDIPTVEELLELRNFSRSEIPTPIVDSQMSLRNIFPMSLSKIFGRSIQQTSNLADSEAYTTESRNLDERGDSKQNCSNKSESIGLTNQPDLDNRIHYRRELSNLQPVFSESLARIDVPPPPNEIREGHFEGMPAQTTLWEPRRPFNPHIPKESSILAWLPEPYENTGESFSSHTEIEPELALLLHSRQAYQLSQEQKRTILKPKKSSRRVL